LLFVFNSCVKDSCTRRYVYWEPVYRTKDEVRANIKNNPVSEIESPGKIYIRGNYIFLNELDRGIHVIDNSNRSAPRRGHGGIAALVKATGLSKSRVRAGIADLEELGRSVTFDSWTPLTPDFEFQLSSAAVVEP
jgi:hypothetical protein